MINEAKEDVQELMKDPSMDNWKDVADLNITQNLNIFVPDIPDTRLRIELDGLELYMQLNTKLSGKATYTLNLYTSKSPIGVSITDENEIGAIITVDLVLSAEAAIDINSGFHIRLEDGFAIDIAMFAEDIGNIAL